MLKRQIYKIFVSVRGAKEFLAGLTHQLFYLGEPARIRGRRFQASQTHIHGPTLGNVVPSCRAVGLSVAMFLAIHSRMGESSFAHTTRYTTIIYNSYLAKNISTSIPLARPSATSSRFAANHPIPSPANFPLVRIQLTNQLQIGNR